MGLPFFSYGWGWVFSFKLCLVQREDCPLFTFHLDSWQSPFHASFSYFFSLGGGGQRKEFLSSWHVGPLTCQELGSDGQIKLAHCKRKIEIERQLIYLMQTTIGVKRYPLFMGKTAVYFWRRHIHGQSPIGGRNSFPLYNLYMKVKVCPNNMG
jgi:hypothetical protein